jgi:LysR family nitrogen assimilation transcriptional regulator
LAELLANGRLDMAVLFRDMETRGVSVQPLLDEDLFLIGDIGQRNASEADPCPMRLLDRTPSCSRAMPKDCVCLSSGVLLKRA